MPRHSISGIATVAPTAVRAAASLFSVASRTVRLREVGVFNTTAIAAYVALARFTNATGVGAGLSEAQWDTESGAPVATGFAGHTADGAVGGVFRTMPLPAAVGGGVIWTFGDGGIEIPAGTANGIGVICPSGTGQIMTYYFDWDE